MHPSQIETGRKSPVASHAEHAFAIVRLDDFMPRDTPLENCVSIKKIVGSVDEAEREVQRLNALHQPGVRYIYQTTRLAIESGAKSPPVMSRLYRLHEQPAPRLAGLSQEEVEAINVPEYIWKATKDGGFGFPGARVYDVLRAPTEAHQIHWKELLTTIYTRKLPGFVDTVGVAVTEQDSATFASFAFRAFDDLAKGFAELSPLEIVTAFAERFGLTISVGAKSGKFFLREQFPLPTIILPGVREGQIFAIEKSQLPHVMGSCVRIDKPLVSIALAFCISTTAYQEWLDSHQPTLRTGFVP